MDQVCYNGSRIFAEIARREQSVPEFARDVGIAPASVYRALSNRKPNTRTLGKLATALGLNDPLELIQAPTVGAK